MSGISDGYLTELQHDHLSFEQELEQCRLDAVARFDDVHGPCVIDFYDDIKRAVEGAGKHGLLKDTALKSMFNYLGTCTERQEFEAAVGDIINHLAERPR